MRKYILLLTVSCFLILTTERSSGQEPRHCATMEYLAKQKAADPGLESRMQAIEDFTRDFEAQTAGMKTSNTVITIPVVFHILWYTAAQNISNARIYDQINTLNRDYGRMNADTGNTPAAFRPVAANTNIQFCLAQQDPGGAFTTGIIRKQISFTGFDPYSNDNIKYTAQGGDDAWDRNNYLNIWVSNFIGASTQIIGISQFPGGSASTDGCVVLYGTVGGENYHGTTQGYNLGRTLTHEVGHWLNLRHIWGDDGNLCTGSDYVSDTPNQADENYGCVSFPHISCSNGPNGDMFMNYMDYGDDNCLNMFTAGQGTRMVSTLNGPRQSLKNSTKCEDLTSVSNPSGQIPFSIYPNPSSGEFILSSQLNDRSDVKITVTNLLGKVVLTKEFHDLPYIVQKIDLSSEANGLYLVEVRTPGAVSTGKFVKN